EYANAEVVLVVPDANIFSSHRPAPLLPPPSPPSPTGSTSELTDVQARFPYDLESLWWIILWILLCHIKDPDTRSSLTSQLHGVIHPKVYPFVGYLDNIHKELCRSYMSPEKLKERFDPRSYGDTYHDVWVNLSHFISGVWNNTIPLGDGFRRTEPAHIVPHKRQRALARDEDSYQPDEGQCTGTS
ncbi:hypothetical protein P691DRAFT_783235, partial [Macrolepiota fuliginosa MF-IS2]